MKDSSASVFEFMVQEVSAQGKFRVRESGVVCDSGPVLHAVDYKGHASLLVPVESLSAGQLDWTTKALALQFKELDVDGRLTPFLVLQCLDPKLQDQFGLMSDDVLDAIEDEPAKALKVAIATIDRWRQLFEHERGSLLGPAQLAGVMAELIVLQRLVEIHGPKAVVAWQGPDGGRHDFVFDGCSVEVKATTNHNNMIVTIHGARQLLAPENAELYIWAFQLERTPTGVAVPEQVQALIRRGVPRLDLLTKLAEVGYQDTDSDAYQNTKFQALADKTFLVDSDFPRITPETLRPSGIIDKISNISYSVDLGQFQGEMLCVESLALPAVGSGSC